VATVTINVAAIEANDDFYSTLEGQTLTISAATGVLANDVSATGSALTAIISTQPTNGSLTLNSDGSFSYTPNAGFIGSDSFTYVATDGTYTSGPAAVTINVQSPALLRITSITRRWRGRLYRCRRRTGCCGTHTVPPTPL
jgi:VCBS repeat-containing protein